MSTMDVNAGDAVARREQLLELLRKRPDRSAILCDIDGTLARIVPSPEDAFVPERAREILTALNKRYALVACISGRRATDARRIVGIGPIAYVGNHGLEFLAPGAQRPRIDGVLSKLSKAVRSFANESYTRELRNLGVRSEDKESIWSFHWRRAKDDEAARRALERVASAATERGLAPHWGRKVLEIRPALPIDKGTAVASALTESDVEAALYAGDDTTDLDAFRKLRELVESGDLRHAVCVGVQSSEGPPEITIEADLVVDGPSGLLELLESLKR